jgi:hypothetical protein
MNGALLALIHQRPSQWQLVTEAALHGLDLPLALHPAQPGGWLPQALAGLAPLGFVGALIEEPEFQREAAGLVQHHETEVRQGGRTDLVVVERTGLRAYYMEPLALAALLDEFFLGQNLLWMGPPRLELVQGLRSVRSVAVATPLPMEAESMMARVPAAQRGSHGILAQSAGLSRMADVVVYAGGSLPLEALQPYHTLLALQAPPREALRLVGQYLGPEELPARRLSLALEVLGYRVAPERFRPS